MEHIHMENIHINNNYEKNLYILYNNKNYIINKKLYNNLCNTKLDIDKNEKKWNKYKKYKNEYEYIYTSSYNYKNISNIISISRSFYKLHEIIYNFNILNKDNINICCIAEAPGGFIQSLLYNIKYNDIKLNNIYGITLVSDNIPVWNYKIKNNKNIKLLYGIDNTGDICNIENINNYIEIIGENTCDILTCDGGIDYSNDYNNQELLSFDFLYNEIFLSLQLQKEDGTLIIKMFDLLYYSSIQLIYILYLCYGNIHIYKPDTSRPTNSEKYIICKNYKYNKEVIKFLKDNYTNKTILLYIPKLFIENINYYNNIYIENQINNINEIIELINSNKILLNRPTKNQKKRAIEWCNKYKIKINNNCIYLNKF